MRGEGYYERTVSNVVKERYLPSVRGRIVDRKGTALADKPPGVQYLCDAEAAEARTRAELSRMLGLSDDEIEKIDERLAVGKKRAEQSGPRARRSGTRKINRAALVEQARTRLPGVEVRHEPYRYYRRVSSRRISSAT